MPDQCSALFDLDDNHELILAVRSTAKTPGSDVDRTAFDVYLDAPLAVFNNRYNHPRL